MSKEEITAAIIGTILGAIVIQILYGWEIMICL